MRGAHTIRAITQPANRPVIEAAARVARVAWAITDHYWYDGAEGARVRVTKIVVVNDPRAATPVTVDGDARVVVTVRVPCLTADLPAPADVRRAGAEPLRASAGLTSLGYGRVSDGFVLPCEEARALLARPTQRTPTSCARSATGRTWSPAREALAGLPRYLVTPEPSEHRAFVFPDQAVAPDGALVCVASDDAFHLGVLSSALHRAWAPAAGARMGIDATPRHANGPRLNRMRHQTPRPHT